MTPLRSRLALLGTTAAVLAGCAAGPQGPHVTTGATAVHKTAHVVHEVAPGDLNGDGQTDFAVSGRVGEGEGFSSLQVVEAGRFRSELRLQYELPQLATGDFDADGHTDFAGLSGPAARNDVRIFYGRDGHFPQTATRTARPGEARTLAAGDITGDGVTDLVVGYKTFREQDNIAVFPGGPDRNRGGRPRMYRAPGVPIASLAADVDGDGDTDLALLRADRQVQVLANRGGRLRQASAYSYGSAASGERLQATLTTGDFDDDGDADLAVADAREQPVFLFSGDTQPALAGTYRFAGRAPVDLAAVNLDKRGGADLMVLLGEENPELRTLQIASDGNGLTFRAVGHQTLEELAVARRLHVTDFDQSGPLDAVIWGGSVEDPRVLTVRGMRIVHPEAE